MNEIESIGLIEESMRKLESEKMIDGVLNFSEGRKIQSIYILHL